METVEKRCHESIFFLSETIRNAYKVWQKFSAVIWDQETVGSSPVTGTSKMTTPDGVVIFVYAERIRPGNSHADPEGKVFDLLFAEAVLLHQLRAAGIGTQSGILIVNADNGILWA